MRVVAFDPGFNIGFAALGGGKPAASGSHLLRGGPRQMGVAGRHCDQIVREIILRERPDVVAFASPHVAMVNMKTPKGMVRKPINPDSIRGLMGFMTVIEIVCCELRLRCIEISESDARQALLGKVPRRTKEIKLAIMAACKQRGWPVSTNHAADALCIAARALEILGESGRAHEVTPIFSAAIEGAGQ